MSKKSIIRESLDLAESIILCLIGIVLFLAMIVSMPITMVNRWLKELKEDIRNDH